MIEFKKYFLCLKHTLKHMIVSFQVHYSNDVATNHLFINSVFYNFVSIYLQKYLIFIYNKNKL